MGRLKYSTESSTRDVEIFLNKEDLTGITREMTRNNGCKSYRRLNTAIFLTFIETILEDVIEKGIAVMLPSYAKSKLYVVRTKNKTKETDHNVFDIPYKYMVVLSTKINGFQKNYYCYLSKNLQDRIDYNAFNGVGYFDSIIML